MERNELMDDLRSLAQLVTLEQRRTIDAAVEELDSDVMQVLRLEAVIRVLNADAGDLVAEKQKEIDDLNKRRDNLWGHLSRAWEQWHERQREINHARFEAKEDRLRAKDATARGNFFLRQLSKFGLGYHNVNYDGGQPGSSREVARSLKVVSRDTIHPEFVAGTLHPQAACPHGKLWQKTGKPRDHRELDCTECSVHQRDAVHTLRRQTAGGECPHGQAWDDCPDCRH